jgi:lipopolysaccharide export system permease protein
MGRVNRYLLSQFVSTFASLFFTLFFLVSIVYFVQIARITSIIHITFLELSKLYLFLLPKILIFTLPITFFIALAIVLFRLSKDNETIVLFTLGFSPKKIANFFIVISSLLSLFLVVNVLVLIPLSSTLQLNFIQYKKAEAKFNIKETEFGQKFSDWLVFVNDAEPDKYKNIIMYLKEKNKDNIISSSEAHIINEDGEVRLELNKGKAYNIDIKSINQLDFDTMIIRTIINDKIVNMKGTVEYWSDILFNKKKQKDLVFNLLLALFPLATVLFAISFGIVTYRYQQGGIYVAISIIILTYFGLTFVASSFYQLYSFTFVFLLFLFFSILYFKKKILNYY